MQRIYPVDLNNVGARTTNARTHFVERMGQILNLGFLSGILDNRCTLRKRRRHHEIFGGSNGRQVEIDFCAAEPNRGCLDITMGVLDGRAH